MKKLFLTSAVVSIASIGATSSAAANSVDTITDAEFSHLLEVVKTSSIATDLHTGDFQAIARQVSNASLYDGSGSSLMKTMRRLRY